MAFRGLLGPLRKSVDNGRLNDHRLSAVRTANLPSHKFRNGNPKRAMTMGTEEIKGLHQGILRPGRGIRGERNQSLGVNQGSEADLYGEVSEEG